MIRGIGCDLCAIPRMEEILQDGRFLRRYFTADERAYILDRVQAAQTAAGIFAAKEALLKALGTGFRALRWIKSRSRIRRLARPPMY